MSRGGLGALDENEAVLVKLGGVLEFAMERRKAAVVFDALVVTEYGDEDVAARDLVEVNFVGPAVGGGHVFEDERHEETAEQRVVAQVVAQGGALCGEFALHRADENAFGAGHGGSGSVVRCGAVASRGMRAEDGRRRTES